MHPFFINLPACVLEKIVILAYCAACAEVSAERTLKNCACTVTPPEAAWSICPHHLLSFTGEPVQAASPETGFLLLSDAQFEALLLLLLQIVQ